MQNSSSQLKGQNQKQIFANKKQQQNQSRQEPHHPISNPADTIKRLPYNGPKMFNITRHPNNRQLPAAGKEAKEPKTSSKDQQNQQKQSKENNKEKDLLQIKNSSNQEIVLLEQPKKNQSAQKHEPQDHPENKRDAGQNPQADGGQAKQQQAQNVGQLADQQSVQLQQEQQSQNQFDQMQQLLLPQESFAILLNQYQQQMQLLQNQEIAATANLLQSQNQLEFISYLNNLKSIQSLMLMPQPQQNGEAQNIGDLQQTAVNQDGQGFMPQDFFMQANAVQQLESQQQLAQPELAGYQTQLAQQTFLAQQLLQAQQQAQDKENLLSNLNQFAANGVKLNNQDQLGGLQQNLENYIQEAKKNEQQNKLAEEGHNDTIFFANSKQQFQQEQEDENIFISDDKIQQANGNQSTLIPLSTVKQGGGSSMQGVQVLNNLSPDKGLYCSKMDKKDKNKVYHRYIKQYCKHIETYDLSENTDVKQNIVKVGSLQLMEREEVVLSFQKMQLNMTKNEESVKLMIQNAGLKSRLFNDNAYSNKKKSSMKNFKKNKKQKNGKNNGGQDNRSSDSDLSDPQDYKASFPVQPRHKRQAKQKIKGDSDTVPDRKRSGEKHNYKAAVAEREESSKDRIQIRKQVDNENSQVINIQNNIGKHSKIQNESESLNKKQKLSDAAPDPNLIQLSKKDNADQAQLSNAPALIQTSVDKIPLQNPQQQVHIFEASQMDDSGQKNQQYLQKSGKKQLMISINFNKDEKHKQQAEGGLVDLQENLDMLISAQKDVKEMFKDQKNQLLFKQLLCEYINQNKFKDEFGSDFSVQDALRQVNQNGQLPKLFQLLLRNKQQQDREGNGKNPQGSSKSSGQAPQQQNNASENFQQQQQLGTQINNINIINISNPGINNEGHQVVNHPTQMASINKQQLEAMLTSFQMRQDLINKNEEILNQSQLKQIFGANLDCQQSMQQQVMQQHQQISTTNQQQVEVSGPDEQLEQPQEILVLPPGPQNPHHHQPDQQQTGRQPQFNQFYVNDPSQIAAFNQQQQQQQQENCPMASFGCAADPQSQPQILEGHVLNGQLYINQVTPADDHQMQPQIHQVPVQPNAEEQLDAQQASQVQIIGCKEQNHQDAAAVGVQEYAQPHHIMDGVKGQQQFAIGGAIQLASQQPADLQNDGQPQFAYIINNPDDPMTQQVVPIQQDGQPIQDFTQHFVQLTNEQLPQNHFDNQQQHQIMEYYTVNEKGEIIQVQPEDHAHLPIGLQAAIDQQQDGAAIFESMQQNDRGGRGGGGGEQFYACQEMPRNAAQQESAGGNGPIIFQHMHHQEVTNLLEEHGQAAMEHTTTALVCHQGHPMEQTVLVGQGPNIDQTASAIGGQKQQTLAEQTALIDNANNFNGNEAQSADEADQDALQQEIVELKEDQQQQVMLHSQNAAGEGQAEQMFMQSQEQYHQMNLEEQTQFIDLQQPQQYRVVQMEAFQGEDAATGPQQNGQLIGQSPGPEYHHLDTSGGPTHHPQQIYTIHHPIVSNEEGGMMNAVAGGFENAQHQGAVAYPQITNMILVDENGVPIDGQVMPIQLQHQQPRPQQYEHHHLNYEDYTAVRQEGGGAAIAQGQPTYLCEMWTGEFVQPYQLAQVEQHQQQYTHQIIDNTGAMQLQQVDPNDPNYHNYAAVTVESEQPGQQAAIQEAGGQQEEGQHNGVVEQEMQQLENGGAQQLVQQQQQQQHETHENGNNNGGTTTIYQQQYYAVQQQQQQFQNIECMQNEGNEQQVHQGQQMLGDNNKQDHHQGIQQQLNLPQPNNQMEGGVQQQQQQFYMQLQQEMQGNVQQQEGQVVTDQTDQPQMAQQHQQNQSEQNQNGQAGAGQQQININNQEERILQ